ncbi:hypothetical protein WJX74_009604 [Apatococcus lobatus]|uniref:SET domain-containing protein n=1 Tax=Apatococcus lobatus TaxID=904363 RepID=A0AAW1S5V6_9CHLO
METFCRWAHAQGIDSSSIAVGGLHERELVAIKDINAGGCFVSVPQKVLLLAFAGLSDAVYGPLLQRLMDKNDKTLDERYLLCLSLLIERCKGPGSARAPYLDILPSSFEDTFWWPEADRALLTGTSMGRAVQEYEKGLVKLAGWRDQLVAWCREQHGGWAGPLEDWQNGWGLTEKATRWARSVVWSRAFRVPLGEQGHGLALVPFADLLDHDPSVHIAWHAGFTGNDDFQMVTFSPIAKGSILFNNYGFKSNEELLLSYGFMLPDNLADFFHITLSLGASPTVPQLYSGPGNSAELDAASTRAQAAACHLLFAALKLPRTHFLRMASPLPGTLLKAATLAILPEPLAYAHLARIPAQTLHGIADGSILPAAAATHSPNETADQPHNQLQLQSVDRGHPDVRPATGNSSLQPFLASNESTDMNAGAGDGTARAELFTGGSVQAAVPEPGMNGNTGRHAAMPPVIIEMRPAQQLAAVQQDAIDKGPAQTCLQPRPPSVPSLRSTQTAQAGSVGLNCESQGPGHSQHIVSTKTTQASNEVLNRGSQGTGYIEHAVSTNATAGDEDNLSVDLDQLPVAAQLKAIASLASRLRAELSRMDGGDAAADRALLAEQPYGGSPGLSNTARMALGYRAGQKAIAEASLKTLTCRLGSLLHQASQVWAAVAAASGLPDLKPCCRHRLAAASNPNLVATGQHDSSPAQPDASYTCSRDQAGATPVRPTVTTSAENVQRQQAVAGEPQCLLAEASEAETASAETAIRGARDGQRLPAGLAATVGGVMNADSASWGMRVESDLLPGHFLARVESHTMLSATSSGGMLDQLVSAALSVLQGEELPAAHQVLLMELMSNVCGTFAAQLAYGGADADCISEILQGTPAEDTLQDECQQLQQAFQAWAQTSAVAQHHLASSGTASIPEAGSAQQTSQAALLGCFCWAHAVTERCCLQSQHGPCIVPQISSIPPAIRSLAIQLLWSDDSRSLEARAAVPMQAGTLLCQAVLLPGSDAEEVLVSVGPACLAALHHSQQKGMYKAVSHYSYPISLAPPEEDEHYALKEDLLARAGWLQSHHLHSDMTPAQLSPVLATIATSLADGKHLQEAQAQPIHEDAQKTGASANGNAQHMAKAQTTALLLLEQPKLRKAAEKQLRSLIRTARDAMVYPEPAGAGQGHLQMQGVAVDGFPGAAASLAQALELEGARCYAASVWHVLDDCYDLLRGSTKHGSDHRSRKRKH